MTASISVLMELYCLFRSTSGIFIVLLRNPVWGHGNGGPGAVRVPESAWQGCRRRSRAGDVLRHDGARADHDPVADLDRQDRGIRPDGDVVADGGGAPKRLVAPGRGRLPKTDR